MKMNYIMSYTKINSEWNKDKYEKGNQTNAFQHEKKQQKTGEHLYHLKAGKGFLNQCANRDTHVNPILLKSETSLHPKDTRECKHILQTGREAL